MLGFIVIFMMKLILIDFPFSGRSNLINLGFPGNETNFLIWSQSVLKFFKNFHVNFLKNIEISQISVGTGTKIIGLWYFEETFWNFLFVFC